MPADADTAGDLPLPGARGRFTVLDGARARTLTAWCAELIPAARGRPSAADIGAAEYADAVWARSPASRAALVRAVHGLDARARQLAGQPFAECPASLRIECLHAFKREFPEPFELVLGLAYEAYYSAPPVLAALERTTGWRSSNVLTGSQMPPFDMDLLARVRSLPRHYRETD